MSCNIEPRRVQVAEHEQTLFCNLIEQRNLVSLT